MTTAPKPVSSTNPAYLSAKKACIYLDISLTSLTKLIAQNEVRRFPVLDGRDYRLKVTELDAYMERQARKAS